MSDAVDAPSQQAGFEPVEATGERPPAPQIIYDEARDPASRVKLSLIAVGLTLFGSLIAFIVVVELTGIPPSSMRSAVTMMAFTLVVVTVMLLTRRLIDWRRRRWLRALERDLRRQIESGVNERGAARDELIERLLLTQRRKLRHLPRESAGADYIRECRAFGRAAPRVLVHARAADRADLRGLRLIADMLEPEFVDEQRVNPWTRYPMVAVGVVVLAFLFFGYGRDIWPLACVGVIWLGLFVAKHSELTHRFPFVHLVSYRWIAAPGCVQLLTSRGAAARSETELWTVAEALLEVEQPPFAKGIRVRLLGEKRSPWCSYDSIYNPGFIALWRRWNHPHPRPELLLGEEAASAGVESR